MKQIRAYRRNEDGTLSIIAAFLDSDGAVGDGFGPWQRQDETATLLGWPDEGEAVVYKNGGGVEFIVPVPHEGV